MGKTDDYHVPVMLAETLAGLSIKPDGRYLDTTAGGGGHSAAILEKLSENGQLLAIDRDDDALTVLRTRFADEGRISIHKLNFGDIGVDEAVQALKPFDGILYDFGVSSHQIDNSSRGFSFMKPGPLDMRMDQSQKMTAAEVVNQYDEASLIRLLREFGEEPRAKRVAQEIIKHRPVDDTAALVAVLEPLADPRDRMRIMARVYQGIRIEVNSELDAIDRALAASYELLSPGGKLVALSYHSLEDRKIKRFMRRMEGDSKGRYIPTPGFAEKVVMMRAVPRKAITASKSEIEMNQRSRSCRLRISEKVG